MSLKNFPINNEVIPILVTDVFCFNWFVEIKKHGVSDIDPCYGVFLFLVLKISIKNKKYSKNMLGYVPFFCTLNFYLK